MCACTHVCMCVILCVDLDIVVLTRPHTGVTRAVMDLNFDVNISARCSKAGPEYESKFGSFHH